MTNKQINKSDRENKVKTSTCCDDRYSKSIANEQQMLKYISKLTRPEDKVSLLSSYCKLMCFNFK